MSKMNKADLYKLCKELQEENKRLQFDNNCLEEDKEKLKEENKHLYDKVKSLEWSQNVHITQKDREIKELKEDINMLKEEYDGKILYLQEHYDEWKNKNAINHLHKNYNHQEFMKGLGIVINQ